MKKLFASVLCVALAITMSPINLIAAGRAIQPTTGIISGIASVDGKPLANVTVRLRNVDNGQLVGNATANATGEFSFTGLGPGNFIVETVAANGTLLGTSATIVLSVGAMVATGVTVVTSAAAAAAAGVGGAAGAAGGAGAAGAGAAGAGAAGAGAAAAGAGAAGAAAGAAAAGGAFLATTAGIITAVAVGAGITAAVVAATNDASASQ